MDDKDKISSNSKIDKEVDRLVSTADGFGMSFSEQETKALKQEAQRAVVDFESADPERQIKGKKGLDSIKNRLLAKTKERFGVADAADQAGDEGGSKTIDSYADSIYQDILAKNAAGLAGARIANGLIDVRAATFLGEDPQKAVKNIIAMTVPAPQMKGAIIEAVARLDGFAISLDENANGTLDAGELRKGGIAAKDGASITVAEFAKPLLEASKKLEHANPATEFKEVIAEATGLLTPPKTPPASSQHAVTSQRR